MTNKDLYSALSNVDPDMVLDAQPAQRRTRPVWAKAVAITACACLTVGVLAALPFIAKWAEPDTPIVPGETVTPEQTEQQTEVPTAGQVIGDPIQGTVFLYVPSEEERVDNTIPENFSASTAFGVYTNKERVSLNDAKKEDKVSPLTGESIEYKYTISYRKTSTAGEFGTYYSQFDRFENDSEIIDYLHGTDQIMYYSIPSESDPTLPLMSEEEVKAIAEEFILNVVSTENFEQLSYVQMSMDPLDRYALLYVRYINGYPTDETISIWIDKDGTVSGYNGYNIGKYNLLDSMLSKQALDTAYNTLSKQINKLELSELNCHEPQLITSSTGVVFLRIAITYIDQSGMRCSDIVMTNVQ